ncbi:UNKNOWN [Stylonychia lemnae]|uniref:Uncharacterized protein n=1 Tax=Stylonychia lemnae TaxID=5949 RepID=A0A078B8M4_STYLE|nr:UNKNOWN [Stylonychia lemnae]|eukprot:CDW90764.1 UNKNOWN [Stylonychia lemnae]
MRQYDTGVDHSQLRAYDEIVFNSKLKRNRMQFRSINPNNRYSPKQITSNNSTSPSSNQIIIKSYENINGNTSLQQNYQKDPNSSNVYFQFQTDLKILNKDKSDEDELILMLGENKKQSYLNKYETNKITIFPVDETINSRNNEKLPILGNNTDINEINKMINNKSIIVEPTELPFNDIADELEQKIRVKFSSLAVNQNNKNQTGSNHSRKSKAKKNNQQDLDVHLHKMVNRHRYIENALYLKGLNNDYKVLHDVHKIERDLERKLAQPSLKINKGNVLSQLKKSVFNNTFLIRQRKEQVQLDSNLTSMGINLDIFRSAAKRMLRRKKYENKNQNFDGNSRKSSSEDEQVLGDSPSYKNYDQRFEISKSRLNQTSRQFFDQTSSRLQTICKDNYRTSKQKKKVVFSIDFQNNVNDKNNDDLGQNTLNRSLRQDQDVLHKLDLKIMRQLQNKSSNGHTSKKPQKLSLKRKHTKLSEDQEIQNESRQVNRLLLKTNDQFLQKKIQTFYNQ